ncbi:MAG: histidinol dehydrogenase [Oscillospiraceae bacterium]|jgi:histidinol dehydrogenase|nr:histidinol dehydrogenase [Oscillospiraceae bacterium]
MIKIINYTDLTPSHLRPQSATSEDVSATVADIIADVRRRGDDALFDYTRRFDGADLTALEVARGAWDAAVADVEPDFLRVLERAAQSIESFHRNQIRSGFVAHGADGTVMGQKILPIERVAVYIPGGTAPLASSVLMSAVPAKLAGVSEIIMATPPSKDGLPSKYILAAAKIAGVDRVFSVGGAHIVAALAYGTETVPRVDKIVGPGNAYVAEAKRQVYGVVGIDMIAGPSDVCVIADGAADAVIVAADMLAQAEHDANARAVLITTSEALATAVAAEIETQLAALPRRDIAAKSIENNGLIIVADTIARAVEISNDIAPEHLELCVDDAFDYLGAVRNAGSVFLGRHTPEAVGDYLAGPNHTLPTLGTARFASPLSVDDFVKKTQFTYFSRDALADIGGDVVSFAEHESLRAHGLSVSKRLEVRD